MLGFSTILEFFGLEGIEGIDVFFAAMAVIGTVLFTIYFLLVLIGGVADGIADAIPFVDVNFENGCRGRVPHAHHQGLLSFMMMFGILVWPFPKATTRRLAIGAGSLAGLSSMWVVGKVFQAIAGLETDGTVVHNMAHGAKGTVYRTIKPGQSGQVRLSSRTPCEPVKPWPRTRHSPSKPGSSFW
ncbi:MAG: hypothetical protein CM15mP78_05620 [Candidatus Poseidoniales archaeon]|nr:MAG: hypothetical protein CM15mP78_05620 [Candidatus Poseidoniales archaeon]